MVCFMGGKIEDNSDVELSKKLRKPLHDMAIRDIYENMGADKRDLVDSIVFTYYKFCKCTDMEKNAIMYLVDSTIAETMKG